MLYGMVWYGRTDDSWVTDSLAKKYTDEVHKRDKVGGGHRTREHYSEGVKRCKLHALRSLIDTLKMEQVLCVCVCDVMCHVLSMRSIRVYVMSSHVLWYL